MKGKINISWFMTIECELTHDLIVRGWNFPHCNFPLKVSNTFCNFPPRVSDGFCNFLQFPQREKVRIFFFWQWTFMCKHLYRYSFLVLSLSLKKRWVLSLTNFFFFCWILYCFLHLNFLYVKVYLECRLKNVKKGL